MKYNVFNLNMNLTNNIEDKLDYSNLNNFMLSVEKNKIDLWTYFYYDQKVKINIKYIDNINVEEQYLNLDGTPFSGEFEYVDVEKNKKEIRKIKDGLRNGKTTIIDLETNKTISKESYKDGQLKE